MAVGHMGEYQEAKQDHEPSVPTGAKRVNFFVYGLVSQIFPPLHGLSHLASGFCSRCD